MKRLINSSDIDPYLQTADDKKLIEIYTAITKEMAVKYGAFYENAV